MCLNFYLRISPQKIILAIGYRYNKIKNGSIYIIYKKNIAILGAYQIDRWYCQNFGFIPSKIS